MGIKVYLHYDDGSGEKKTSKLSVPDSWSNKLVSDVIGLFIKSYNSKNEKQLVVEDVHLENEEKIKIHSNATVASALSDHGDYNIKHGSYLKSAKTEIINPESEGKVRCKNYGCNQYFLEAENNDTSCQHHTGPPIFHDTMKCWSCCKDIKKAYDFEEFQKIQGCAVGKHSTTAQSIAISASPNAVDASVFNQPTQILKSIEEDNLLNPNAVTAASAAMKILNTRKNTRNADGITARCQRKGCGKTINISENNVSACTYHSGQPIFHDAVKFWNCCSSKKCYDFDEFMAVVGCTTGFHDDGVISLE